MGIPELPPTFEQLVEDAAAFAFGPSSIVVGLLVAAFWVQSWAGPTRVAAKGAVVMAKGGVRAAKTAWDSPARGAIRAAASLAILAAQGLMVWLIFIVGNLLEIAVGADQDRKNLAHAIAAAGPVRAIFPSTVDDFAKLDRFTGTYVCVAVLLIGWSHFRRGSADGVVTFAGYVLGWPGVLTGMAACGALFFGGVVVIFMLMIILLSWLFGINGDPYDWGPALGIAGYLLAAAAVSITYVTASIYTLRGASAMKALWISGQQAVTR